jgi:hypothetical protein
MKPAVSLVVSGFGVREASWDRLRMCLRAVARQEAGPVEVVLVKMTELHGEVPEDIRDILPGTRIVRCENSDPWARKTVGARAAASPIVAFVDADCMPQLGWLQSLLEVFQYYPEVAVVRGVEERNWLRRMLPGRRAVGPARSTAANNVAFRREAYLDCPFPEGAGAKAVPLQTAAMLRAGYVLWAEPAMQVIGDRRGLKQASGAQVLAERTL